MKNIVGAIICGIITIICFLLSYFQFKEKGFLFNNAYLYASQQERQLMNKKPYYKQSGLVFTLIGILFLINTLEMIFETGWLFFGIILIAGIIIIYAIISSIMIASQKK